MSVKSTGRCGCTVHAEQARDAVLSPPLCHTRGRRYAARLMGHAQCTTVVVGSVPDPLTLRPRQMGLTGSDRTSITVEGQCVTADNTYTIRPWFRDKSGSTRPDGRLEAQQRWHLRAREAGGHALTVGRSQACWGQTGQ